MDREANETITCTDGDGNAVVDILVSQSTTIREPANEQDACSDHTWEPRASRTYEKPDPDPRNPFGVFRCKHCTSEKHTSLQG